MFSPSVTKSKYLREAYVLDWRVTASFLSFKRAGYLQAASTRIERSGSDFREHLLSPDWDVLEAAQNQGGYVA